MSDERRPLLLGLHRLVESFGEGRVPELLMLCAVDAASVADRSEWPAKVPVAKGNPLSTRPGSNDNVIPFRPYLLARMRRRR